MLPDANSPKNHAPNSSFMRITQPEVMQFANWSGDRNPIHVDSDAAKNSAYGGTIVHGALSTIFALRQVSSTSNSGHFISALDIEFRGEIRPDVEYRVESGSVGANGLTCAVLSGDHVQLTIRAENQHAIDRANSADSITCDWSSHARSSGVLTSGNDVPFDWKTTDFRAGATLIGTHRFGEHEAAVDSQLSTTQERVLGLCSYMVGMKAPGLSSLFTRLKVQFTSVEMSTCEFAYRLTFRNYEPSFRMLETELEVATTDGQVVALAELHSYVRFPNVEADPANYGASLERASSELSGKVVLVCGASRGLGAEIAAAFGAVKCHVYLACRHPNATVITLAEKIRSCGGSGEIVAGDVGDSNWCHATRERIIAKHGRLDLLILNACEPPRLEAITSINPQQATNYIGHNIALSQVPLISFMPTIVGSKGTVVAISSSAVTEVPSGFGDYVAVKMAMEGAIKTAANENSGVRFVIARPGKLRTSWNDSPARAMGVTPPSVVAKQLIEAVISDWERSNLKIEERFDFDESEDLVAKNWQPVEFVLCASFTLDPFGETFDHWSQELQWNIQAIHAPYAQVLQETLNPTSILAKSAGGSVILLRISDWLRELSEEKLSDHEAVYSLLQSLVDEHVDAIKLHRTFAAGPTLLIFCPSSEIGSFSAERLNELQQRMQLALVGTSGLTVLDASEFHSRYEVPENAIFDRLREDIAHIPFQNAYYHFLGTLIVRFFHRGLGKPKKVVVLDCDNTLWRGVVGEVGPEGIVLDEIHHRLHTRLSQLAESGILLCLCSKNEEQDVWSVFDTRTDFGLKREAIVAAEVNWLPKSENIRRLSQTLNLGLDSFIFIDDNPVECAEVRSGCPSVLTVQWPLDATAASGLLEHLWELDVYSTTAEDRKRTQMYREEFQRQRIQSSARNFQDFIDSLQLKIDIDALSVEDVPRASQLTLRTNQFNLTTVRRSETELMQLLADPRYECRTVRVSDRFGDYGLVGFLIACCDEVLLDVDSFMLSCRVLGRGVEHRMAVELGNIALSRGLTKVRFRHIPTERNKPARLFLSKLADGQLPEDLTVACECVSDAIALIETTFQAEAVSEHESEPKEKDVPINSEVAWDRPRQRELQINRIASDLSTYALLATAFGDVASTSAEEESTEDVAEVVRSTFAKSLRLSIEQVCKVDRLESMGCDSLRIVEITVALTRQFPWLPKTLLFEHRSVSEIIQAITDLRSAAPRLGSSRSGTSAVSDNSTSPSGSRNTKEIAIVGMGVRCAGGDSPEELWNFLAQGKSAIRPVPSIRDSFVGQLKDVRTHYAGLLEGAADFDCAFFGISPREAEYMDPQLRLMLQTTWQALEDAGSTGNSFDKSTGVFVGAMYSCYGRFANQVATQTGSIYRCWESFSLANRLSQVLGCNGPSLSIDTACSSSATALHYACESLKRGDCTTAIVSGVNLIVDPDRLVQFTKLGILSPSGRCVPFGAEADGTVLGEGVVTLVLRPLAEARQRGDRVYAVIKGTGVSVGAGSVGFTAPNPVAQATAVQRAIADAQVDARTISYIETHGTGTELGDPIEIRGLEIAYCNSQLWSEGTIHHRCAIGSIKPNIGHLEAGAGLMGVMKAALQLHHRMRLPSTTSTALNPQIDFAQLPFYVQASLESWPSTEVKQSGRLLESPRRAGVNSFGVGGSNVHVIMEECSNSDREALSTLEGRSAHLLVLSAETEAALRLQASKWHSYLERLSPDKIADACYSAVVGRKQYPVRTAIVIEDKAGALAKLKQVQSASHFSHLDTRSIEGSAEGSTEASIGHRTAFLFTGQGSQYPGMFRDLYQSSPVFRDAFDRCARCFDGLLPEPISEIVFSGNQDDKEHPIHQTMYTQSALFSVQCALYQLWNSWGVTGDVLMGHSIGEIAAYCVAGGCSLEDGAKLVAARGRLMQQLPSGGVMCAIPLAADVVRPALNGLEERVSIAAHNGPAQTVISGERQALEEVAQRLAVQHSIKPTMLAVSHAFHSPLIKPMLAEFEAVLRTLTLGTPETQIVSSAIAKVVSHEMADPQYWLDQARNPVLFTEAMVELSRQGVTHYVEIGPHPVMLTMGRQCIDGSDIKWLPSARRGKSDWSVILESVGELYVDRAEVDWIRFYQPYATARLQVPCYQFDARRVWLEQLESQQFRSQALSVTTQTQTNSQLAYRLQWREQPLGDSAPVLNQAGRRWLIVSDQEAALIEAREAIAKHGVDCTPVMLDCHSESTGTITRADGLTYVSSIASLREFTANNQGFERVIYVDSIGKRLSDDADKLNELAVDKCFVLSQLTSLLSQAGTRPRRMIWVVTQNALHVDSTSSHPLTSAPLLGFARVAALEFPDSWGGIADIESWNQHAGGLVRELNDPGDDDQVALRADKRLVPRLHRWSESDSPAQLDLAEVLSNGSILITGGLGSIGIQLATWLSDQGARKVVLASRSGVPSESGGRHLELLRTRGVDVQVVKGDVATQEGIDACLRCIGNSPLVGIFHAAGLDLERPIVDTTRTDIERLFEPKVKGAWLLHRASLRSDLKIFVCLSSISSIWGSTGRSAYASANAFLDELSQHRKDLGLPALVVNLGPWAGGGMADTTALEQLGRIGNRGLQPQATLELIGKLLAVGETQAVIADIEWTRFRPIVEARRSRPIFGDLGREPGTNGDSRNTASDATCASQRRPWSIELSRLAEAERRPRLVERLRSAVADTLRIADPRSIATDRNLFEIGMDSITATEFAIGIHSQTGFRSATLLADHSTINRMADAILNHFTAELTRSQSSASSHSQDAAWIDNLASKSSEARLLELRTMLQRELRATLRVRDESPLDVRKSFSELGLDSLAAVDFATRIRGLVGLPQMPRVHDYKNIEFLASFLAEHVSSTERVSSRAGNEISNYEETLAPAIAQFCEQAWPGRPKQWNLPRWKWMFLESAKRLGIDPKLWLYFDGDRIVGHMGSQHVRLKVGQTVHNTSYLVETMVLESHREKGVGAQIMLQAQEESPFSLSLGQTEQMRSILSKLGWKYISPLSVFHLPINATRVLRGKLPSGIATVGAGLLQLRATSRRLLSKNRGAPVDTQVIDRFESRHDLLWQQVSRCYGCGVVRDASYLNWKYVEQPGQEFVRLEMTREDQVIGCVVLAYVAPNNVYSYSRVNIVEMVVSTRAEDLNAVIHAAVSHGRNQLAADAVVMHVINPSIELALERYGFLRKEPTRHLMVSVDDVNHAGPILDGSQWLVTQGDSDIDRPGQG